MYNLHLSKYQFYDKSTERLLVLHEYNTSFCTVYVLIGNNKDSINADP